MLLSDLADLSVLHDFGCFSWPTDLVFLWVRIFDRPRALVGEWSGGKADTERRGGE